MSDPRIEAAVELMKTSPNALGLNLIARSSATFGRMPSPCATSSAWRAPLESKATPNSLCVWSIKYTFTWSEHRDINEMMLATRLAPDGFLLLASPK